MLSDCKNYTMSWEDAINCAITAFRSSSFDIILSLLLLHDPVIFFCNITLDTSTNNAGINRAFISYLSSSIWFAPPFARANLITNLFHLPPSNTGRWPFRPLDHIAFTSFAISIRGGEIKWARVVWLAASWTPNQCFCCIINLTRRWYVAVPLQCFDGFL